MKPSKPGRRALKWLVFLLLGLFAFYLVAVNLLLGAGLLSPLINRRPEKTFISIGGGWTLLPGRIHVQELLVRGQTQTVQWQLTLGEGSFQVDLPTLIDRRVRISGGSGQDFEFRSRRRLAPGESQSAEQARYLPEIAGLTNPPDPAPEDVDPPPRGSDRKPWRIEVDEVVLGGKSVLWVGPLQVSGSGSIRGGTVVQPDGVLEVPRAAVALDNAEILLAGETLTHDLDLDVEASLAPFRVKESRGTDVLEFMTGEIRMHGGSVDLKSLDRFLPAAAGLELVSGDGTFDLSLTIPVPGQAQGTAEVSVREAQVELSGIPSEGDVDFVAARSPWARGWRSTAAPERAPLWLRPCSSATGAR